jgi:hypothetical protein
MEVGQRPNLGCSAKKNVKRHIIVSKVNYENDTNFEEYDMFM